MDKLRVKVFSALVAVLLLAAACGDGDEEEAEPARRAGVFFGAVSMTTDRVAIALDRANQGGRQRVRAYVVDGLPGGDAEWFEGTALNGRWQLRSASGRAQLEGTVAHDHASGTVVLADGVSRRFHTIPATHGAGIYEVEATADGRYRGTSTDGSTLEARQAGDFVQGTLTSRDGERVDYRVADLSRVFAYELLGGQGDRYTLLVSRYGLTQVGRGGGEALKQGQPSPNLVALDLAASRSPSPGLYYGKLARTTDQFAMVVSPADATGARRVRVYLSDGEPEPEGDIEWFTGAVSGNRLELTSASGQASLVGEVSGEWARGTVTLPGGRSHPFFAVPAGDGAGIYEVEVTPDGRHIGTSEDGSRLALTRHGAAVNGTINTRDGQEIGLFAYDLTRVFEYGIEGSKPDKYLAFASPGGRYLIGRSGNVRGGTSGNNIIGLDKAC